MKNTFGHNLSVTLFGESHGPAIGVVIDGITPGLPVDEDYINFRLSKRRPSGQIETMRREQDKFSILSGVFKGKTTGTPICITIPNEDTRSGDYNYGVARPSHADYAAYCKYHGFEDYRGGGHFSGRITAALVAASGILIPALRNIGIDVGTHILRCGDICDKPFSDTAKEIELLEKSTFPVIDGDRSKEITDYILNAGSKLDSVGGVTQTAVCGMPAGVGEPWFDSLESSISHGMFSVGAIKGIEFGTGFALAGMRGNESNDPIRIENGRVYTETNHNGGINGGISNGMDIVFQCAVKPTPSISSEQDTIDFLKGENTKLVIHGRHDPAIIRRICPVIDSVTAIVICDMLIGRYGTDVLLKGVKPV